MNYDLLLIDNFAFISFTLIYNKYRLTQRIYYLSAVNKDISRQGRDKFKDGRRMNRFGTDILVKFDNRQINFKHIFSYFYSKTLYHFFPTIVFQ